LIRTQLEKNVFERT